METPGPDEVLALELEKLDQELEARQRPDIPLPTVDLITGLLAGLRLAGRP